MFIHLLPGDPARQIAGLEATYDEVEAIREEFGLNKPLIVQSVAEHDDGLLLALGAGGAHVVLPQRLQHGGPGVAGQGTRRFVSINGQGGRILCRTNRMNRKRSRSIGSDSQSACNGKNGRSYNPLP